MRKPRSELKPKPSSPSPTKAIAKIVTFYLENVRRHDKSEYVGIYRQALLMLKNKGVTLAEMSQAVENYSKDQWVKGLPEQKRKHIRKFFMPENMKLWAANSTGSQRDPSLSALDRLNKLATPPQEVPIWKPEPEEEEEAIECDDSL